MNDFRPSQFSRGMASIIIAVECRSTLFEETGFINDQDCVICCQMLYNIISNNILNPAGNPAAAVQNSMLLPRSRIASRLSAQPACLTTFVAKQSAQNMLASAATRFCLKSPRIRLFKSRSEEAQISSIGSIDVGVIYSFYNTKTD